MRLDLTPKPLILVAAASSLLLLVAAMPAATLQDAEMDHSKHAEHQAAVSAPEPTLEEQIAELRASVARLEAALEMNHKGVSMKPMGDEMGMGKGMQQDAKMGKAPMGGPKKGMQSGKPMKKGAMGMGAMGMGSMGAMQNTDLEASALPGFPGASHIYHIGATGFFLDHTDHITLTTEQAAGLAKTREASLLEQATLQRNIDQAEQELWTLTGSDAPDATKIEAKVRAVEKLRGDQRIAFIRAVGKGAQLLTEGQRKQLAGMLPPSEPAAAKAGMNMDM